MSRKIYCYICDKRIKGGADRVRVHDAKPAIVAPLKPPHPFHNIGFYWKAAAIACAVALKGIKGRRLTYRGTDNEASA